METLTRLVPKSGARIFARVDSGIVVELIQEYDNIDDEWHGDFMTNCVDVTDAAPPVEVGWVPQGDGTFAAPPPYVPPPADQMFAALAAGLAITSTVTPALDATYSGTGDRWDAMVHVMTYINAFSAFPGGLSTYDWVALSGTVTFPTTDDFKAVSRAVGDWRAAWQRFVDGIDVTPPAGDATIP
jgi:hypothetical protein